MTERIEADYLIETACDPRKAAEIMAGEQSSSTFVKVPGETAELKARSAARIEHIEHVESVSAPSLPGALRSAGQEIRRARVTLSWPLEVLGPSLPNLMTAIGGNLFELKQFSGLRVLDLRMPDAFASAYCGPKFAVEGTRRLAGIAKGPLIGTIIKPSVGFNPAQTAALVDQLANADIDFIKDDELQADGPYCPFEDRLKAVMDVIDRHADRLGRKIMYAFNLTGSVDEMRARHDQVLERGGTCVMVSLNSVGLAGMIALGQFSELPIHAHRNGWGALSRAPLLGWSYIAWQKFWRLAGADHMHVNGLQNKFCEDDDSVIASARECMTPMFAAKPCTVMPVFSSGQSALQVPETYRRLGSDDLIFAAGGGIMAHPGGPEAGVQSLRDAWSAAITGVPLDEYTLSRKAPSEAREAYVK